MPVIRHRHRLGKTLGFVVDAARADGVHVAPVRLRLRMDQRIAVDLGRRRHQEARVLRHRQAQRVVRPEAPDLERLDRKVQVIDRARWRREVQDTVDVIVDVERLRHVVLDQAESVEGREKLRVVTRSGDEVVDADHLVAIGQEALGEVRAKEAGGAGDENAHVKPPRPESRHLPRPAQSTRTRIRTRPCPTGRRGCDRRG